MVNKSEDEYIKQLEERCPEKDIDLENVKGIVPIVKERISKWSDINKMWAEGELDYFFKKPIVKKDGLICPENLRKGKEVSSEDIKKHLRVLVEKISSYEEEWKKEKIKDALWDYATEEGRGIVLWAMRFALSGKERSPDPFQLAEILRKEQTLIRLRDAINL